MAPPLFTLDHDGAGDATMIESFEEFCTVTDTGTDLGQPLGIVTPWDLSRAMP
jgi:hypothetical protein